MADMFNVGLLWTLLLLVFVPDLFDSQDDLLSAPDDIMRGQDSVSVFVTVLRSPWRENRGYPDNATIFCVVMSADPGKTLLNSEIMCGRCINV